MGFKMYFTISTYSFLSVIQLQHARILSKINPLHSCSLPVLYTCPLYVEQKAKQAKVATKPEATP